MADVRDDSTKDVKKKTRASKPKVKTGCMTCKSRRVKCDETKPFCTRCTRFGYQCDGYGQEPPKRIPKSPPVQYSPRVLVPKSNASSAASSPVFDPTSSPNAAVSPIPQLSQVLGTVFKTDEEYQSFQKFIVQTLVAENEENWKHTLYQAYISSPLIQFTILSVGSFNHEVGINSYKPFPHSLLKPSCLDPKLDSQSTFTASLLLNCFESFYGHRLCAIKAVSDGLHSIGELYSGQGKEELRRILNDQSRRYADARNTEIQDMYSRSGLKSISSLTQGFSTLDEAIAQLELITRCSLHSLACSLHFQTTPGSREFQTLSFGIDHLEQQRMLREYENWNCAFSKLFSTLSSPDGEVDQTRRILVLLLKLFWLSGYLLISSKTSLLPLKSGEFDTRLKELIDIASLTMKINNSKVKELVFDTLDLLPLTIITWQISNATELRYLAWMLLESSHRREGMCDGRLILKTLRFLESETNPNERDREARLRFDATEKVASVFYLRANNMGGDKLKAEVTIPW